MKAKIAATSPDRAEFTLEITMPLGQWKKLREQLSGAYPSWDLSKVIRDLIGKAEESWTVTTDMEL